jgi:hypothetical protein
LTPKEEGRIFNFLGINFKKDGEKIMLSQTGLIGTVLKHTGLRRNGQGIGSDCPSSL